MERGNIIAIGLLTRSDLERLGPTFERAYTLDEAPCFDELLAAIDEADQGTCRDTMAMSSERR